MTKQTLEISPGGIVEATKHINPKSLQTPLLEGVILSGDTPPLLLKDETATPIRCFKGRGTDYYAATLDEASGVVVCASAGNFGQGLARSMQRRGGRAVVFGAKNANPLKLKKISEFGGEVILAGKDFDEANAAARAFAHAKGYVFLEDAASGKIAEGAGTIAKEMTEAGASFDAFYVPVGGGALANGIGTWLKSTSPQIPVIGVCAGGAPSLAKSWEKGRPVCCQHVDTFADGIAVRAPVARSVAHLRAVVDDFVLVSDAEILAAMRAIARATGVLCEPSGAAGIAAIIKDASERGFSHPASLLCGANVTDEKVIEWFGSTS